MGRVDELRDFLRRYGNYHPDERFSFADMLRDMQKRNMPLPSLVPWMGEILDELEGHKE